MSLMNLISQEEFDAMNEYRRLYAYENLSPEDEAPIKDVLRVWDQEKSNYLGKMFDNQLIFSKEIKYKRPHSELRDTFSEYLNVQSDNPMFIFRTYFTKKLEEYFTSEPDYLERAYFVFLGLLDPRILAENKAGIDFSVEINGKKIQVQEDSKPVKIIKKVVTALELDNELFENFRLVHSQILNQKLLTGELCVSIHPLDYMTMSDNENDWSSCMSWTERGCYRRGTVEMLNSSCVVVAYIKSTHNNFRFYGHEWNSKKWRQLFVVTKDFISGVKQYPYENDYFSTEALKLLGELATKNLGWNYYDEVTTFVDRYCGSDARPAKIGDSIKVWLTFSTDDMYNDFHSGYNSFALISSDITADTTLKTHYSGPQICMCCGEVAPCYDDEDGDPSDLICGNCIESESPIYQCTHCDDEIYDGDEYATLSGGDVICLYCYDNGYYGKDVITGKEYADNHLNSVVLKSDEEDYFPIWTRFTSAYPYSIYGYEEAWDKYFKIEQFHSNTENWQSNYYVTKEDCTEEGLKLFRKEED